MTKHYVPFGFAGPGLLASLLSICSVAPAQTPNIQWGGGVVIQNARIISIYWGAPDSGLQGHLDRFYSKIAPSNYLGRLSEYGTGPTQPNTLFGNWFGSRTEQVVGSGTFGGSYVVDPGSPGNVETTDIGPRLDHEIHVGHIPGPDANTIYMVHFARGWQVYLGTNLFGAPVGYRLGQQYGKDTYCAYHAAYYAQDTSRAIVFGAMPNQSELPNCLAGLQPNDAETAYASHELIEAVTDPGAVVIVGGFLSVGIDLSDQAWRAPAGFLGLKTQEVADVCEGQYEQLSFGPDSQDRFLVQATWNKSLSLCLASEPIGNLDDITVEADGLPHVRGWALDPELSWADIPTHIYFDGPDHYGTGFAVLASNARADVNSVTGYAGTHGFDFVVPAQFRDGKPHTVYAYGIGILRANNASGSEDSALLSGVPLIFNSAYRVQPQVQSVMIGSGQAPNQCLDITGQSLSPGAQIQMYSCWGGDNQRFAYHPDTQELRAYNDSNLCLDASGGLGKNGDHLIIWPCNGQANQKWSFNLRNGEIRGVNGKCVDANAASTANGSQVQIWDCNRGANQTWFRK